MKGYFLFISMCSLSIWNNIATGQVQKTKEDFPAYNQIKPSKDDIVDYGGPNSGVRTERKTMNLFDYPAGTVTFIINGKLSTDGNYVRQLLSDKGKDIEYISIGKPDKKGKLVIKIDYNLP